MEMSPLHDETSSCAPRPLGGLMFQSQHIALHITISAAIAGQGVALDLAAGRRGFVRRSSRERKIRAFRDWIIAEATGGTQT